MYYVWNCMVCNTKYVYSCIECKYYLYVECIYVVLCMQVVWSKFFCSVFYAAYAMYVVYDMNYAVGCTL